MTLERAVHRVLAGESIRSVSKDSGIAFSTLHKKVKSNCVSYEKPGAQQVISTEHEKQLVELIELMIARAYNPTAKLVIDYATKVLHQFYPGDVKEKHEKLTRSWFRGFLKRNPHLKLQHVKYMDKNQAQVTEKDVRNWFT